MKPILLRIRKKTKVPTKYQLNHLWRSDWKMAGVISYADSMRMFANIGNGPIKTDAQFAKYLYQSYGEGIYSILAWRKGRVGFWSFLTIELDSSGFARVPKNVTSEEREKKANIRNYKRLQEKLKKTTDNDERQEIKELINDAKDDIEFDEEMAELDVDVKRGPTPYLKQSQPVYRKHNYESFDCERKSEVTVNEFW